MIKLERIGWKDKPDESTPISSGNLKKMEDNTENAINELEKENEYTTVTDGDINDLVAKSANKAVKYWVQGILENAPERAYGWLISYYQSENTQIQIFIANVGNVYVRAMLSAIWQAWKQL